MESSPCGGARTCVNGRTNRQTFPMILDHTAEFQYAHTHTRPPRSGSLEQNNGLKLYYLFDFGDCWLFEVRESGRKKQQTVKRGVRPLLRQAGTIQNSILNMSNDNTANNRMQSDELLRWRLQFAADTKRSMFPLLTLP